MQQQRGLRAFSRSGCEALLRAAKRALWLGAALVALTGCELKGRVEASSGASQASGRICPAHVPFANETYLAALTGCFAWIGRPDTCHERAVEAAELTERCR
jgi:hypothetical protein